MEQGRAHLAEWADHIGLVRRESAKRRFDRADFGWFAAVVYPTASRAGLELMADWFAWLFLVDDQLDDGEFGRSPEHVREVVDRMREVLESGPDAAVPDAASGPGLPTVVASLADLWRRTAPEASPQWRRRFIQHLDDCLTTAAVWETGNRLSGRVPSEDTYIVNRRHTGAIYVCMDLIEIVEPVEVPPELYRDQEFEDALNAACNVVCWTNDIFSLEKERSLGEVHNLAYIVEHHRGMEPGAAVEHVRAAVASETEAFLSAESALLATHPAHRETLEPVLAGMRTWMRGNLDWSMRTKRYHPSDRVDTVRPEEYIESTLVGGE